MILNNSASGQPDPSSEKLFTEAFIRHAHRILLGGYRRLDAASYTKAEEDEITGDLAAVMNLHIERDPSPLARMFQVHDQHPVTKPGTPQTSRRVGKRRLKIDLQFVANTVSGFVRFSWEAKRLGRQHPLSSYLGHDGLGCFLDGRYGSEVRFGGMLGYVQSDTPEIWCDKLKAKLDKSYSKGSDASTSVSDEIRITSRHPRTSGQDDIEIFHSVLRFD
ncbi:hypothetical protein ACFQY0_10470 [Haloferula chungangensis]|uniref:Transposase n=1 Tax=Haloferula chungangensis TaxID=1048331 RepID=A0ABW2L5F9_9BACT